MKCTWRWMQKHWEWQPKDSNELIDTIMDISTKLGLELQNYSFINAFYCVEVLTVEKINNNLKLCTIDFLGEKVKVVCGAENCISGIKTIYAPIGSKIGNITICKKSFLGHESYGMFLSYSEMKIANLSTNNIEENNGIVEYNSIGLYSFDDILFDFFTANRWDFKNVRALIRNFSIWKGNLKDLSYRIGKKGEQILVRNDHQIPISFMRVENINVLEEVNYFMSAIGLKSNDLQNLNNFILYDIGHSIHIYDVSLIRDKIEINSAFPNNCYKTLQGEFITTGEEIIISSNSKALAIGGIIGIEGFNSKTKNCIIEFGFWQKRNITKLVTQSAKINYLGFDSSINTLAYVSTLIKGAFAPEYFGILDLEKKIVLIESSDFYSYTGHSISVEKLINILAKVGFTSRIKTIKNPHSINNLFSIEVDLPSWHLESTKEDILEEVCKFISYDTFDEKSHSLRYSYVNSEESLLKSLLVSKGYNEVILAPFSTRGTIEIMNPMYTSKRFLQEDSLQNMIEKAQEIARNGERETKIFTIAKSFPKEEIHVALLFYGKRNKQFFEKSENEWYIWKNDIWQLKSILFFNEESLISDNKFDFGLQWQNGFCGKVKDGQDTNCYYFQTKLNWNHSQHILEEKYNYDIVEVKKSFVWLELQKFLDKYLLEKKIFIELFDDYKDNLKIKLKIPFYLNKENELNIFHEKINEFLKSF